MKNLSNFLNRISNWKSLVIFLAIYVLFNGFILQNAESRINELAEKPIGVVDLTFGFDPQRTLNMIEGYGEAARTYYAKVEMTLDIVYPIIYAFLFAIILTLLFREKSYAWINKLPFVTMLFDYLENVNILILLKTFPKQSAIFAQMCEVFKLLKWASLGAIVLLIVFGLISKLSSTWTSSR